MNVKLKEQLTLDPLAWNRSYWHSYRRALSLMSEFYETGTRPKSEICHDTMKELKHLKDLEEIV